MSEKLLEAQPPLKALTALQAKELSLKAREVIEVRNEYKVFESIIKATTKGNQSVTFDFKVNVDALERLGYKVYHRVGRYKVTW